MSTLTNPIAGKPRRRYVLTSLVSGRVLLRVVANVAAFFTFVEIAALERLKLATACDRGGFGDDCLALAIGQRNEVAGDLEVLVQDLDRVHAGYEGRDW